MKLKQLTALLLALLLSLSLGSCAAQDADETQSGDAQPEPAVTEEATQAEESTQETEEIAEADTPAAGRVLIVYFSPANADTADAVSAATPRVGDASSVAYLAQLIGSQVEGDTAKIVPAEPYPTDYEETADRAKQEQDEDARPAFTLEVNPEDYDVIFVGYPVWWYQLPMVMETFFDTYDFSGKTIIPFNTHAGSRDGGTYEDIAALEPGATVLDGLAVSGESAGSAEGDVNDWLAELGY